MYIRLIFSLLSLVCVYDACNGMKRTHDQMSGRAIASNQQIQAELAEKIYEQTGLSQDIWIEIIDKTSDFKEKIKMVASLRATNTLFNKFFSSNRVGLILKSNYSQETLNSFLFGLAGHYDQDDQVFWIQSLLQAGAAVNAKNGFGQTPLCRAIWRGHVKAIQVLLEAGAAVDAINDSQETPLHWAAIYEKAEVIPVLLQAGAAVDTKDDFGKTPLYLAVQWGKAEVIPVLLQAGADKYAKNFFGQTPLGLAVRCGCTKAKRLLREYKKTNT
jgi:ankyrin repeat protein